MLRPRGLAEQDSPVPPRRSSAQRWALATARPVPRPHGPSSTRHKGYRHTPDLDVGDRFRTEGTRCDSWRCSNRLVQPDAKEHMAIGDK